MKKFIRRFIATFVVFCVIIGIGLFVLSKQATSFAEKSLSSKLKVPVSIESIFFSLENITINNLDISNLPKSRLPKALTVKQSKSKTSIFNYFKKTIEIEEITLDNIYLGLEFDSAQSTQGNWTILMSNLSSGSTPTPKEEAKAVKIKTLILTNIEVDVAYKTGGKVKRLKTIPKIVLRDINTAEGFPADQIMKSVLGQMLKSIFTEENVKNMLQDILTQPKNAIDTLIQPFKGLF